MNKYGYRFSFGPWNIHEGADPFGPPVRPAQTFDTKLSLYRELGFDAVQFHDDYVVPELEKLTPSQIRDQACNMHKKLQDSGLTAEFVAPRLWEHPMGIDGVDDNEIVILADNRNETLCQCTTIHHIDLM